MGTLLRNGHTGSNDIGFLRQQGCNEGTKLHVVDFQLHSQTLCQQRNKLDVEAHNLLGVVDKGKRLRHCIGTKMEHTVGGLPLHHGHFGGLPLRREPAVLHVVVSTIFFHRFQQGIGGIFQVRITLADSHSVVIHGDHVGQDFKPGILCRNVSQDRLVVRCGDFNSLLNSNAGFQR